RQQHLVGRSLSDVVSWLLTLPRCSRWFCPDSDPESESASASESESCPDCEAD
ncbi:hypothetical protein M5D96_012862, partial [Drosophila gunungcola]